MTEDSLLYFKNGNLERFDLETGKTEILKEGLASTKIYCLKGDIYYETADGVFCNDELLVPTMEYDKYLGVMKADEKTGYGILFDDEKPNRESWKCGKAVNPCEDLIKAILESIK